MTVLAYQEFLMNCVLTMSLLGVLVGGIECYRESEINEALKMILVFAILLFSYWMMGWPVLVHLFGVWK